MTEKLLSESLETPRITGGQTPRSPFEEFACVDECHLKKENDSSHSRSTLDLLLWLVAMANPYAMRLTLQSHA